MRFLRKPAGDPLAISMCGLKLGNRLLVIGASDPALVAGLASKVGLTGRACMLDESPQRTAAAAAQVEKEGALIETFTSSLRALPFDGELFDVVVLRNVLPALDAPQRTAVGREVERVVRPGGRCIAIDDLPRKGVLGMLAGASSGTSPGAIAAAVIGASGFRGVRTLAEREGIVFVEGVKAAQGS